MPDNKEQFFSKRKFVNNLKNSLPSRFANEDPNRLFDYAVRANPELQKHNWIHDVDEAQPTNEVSPSGEEGLPIANAQLLETQEERGGSGGFKDNANLFLATLPKNLADGLANISIIFEAQGVAEAKSRFEMSRGGNLTLKKNTQEERDADALKIKIAAAKERLAIRDWGTKQTQEAISKDINAQAAIKYNGDNPDEWKNFFLSAWDKTTGGEGDVKWPTNYALGGLVAQGLGSSVLIAGATAIPIPGTGLAMSSALAAGEVTQAMKDEMTAMGIADPLEQEMLMGMSAVLFSTAIGAVDKIVPGKIAKRFGFGNSSSFLKMFRQGLNRRYAGLDAVARKAIKKEGIDELSKFANRNLRAFNKITTLFGRIGIDQTQEGTTEVIQGMLAEAAGAGISDTEITLEWVVAKLSSSKRFEEFASGIVGTTGPSTVSNVAAMLGGGGGRKMAEDVIKQATAENISKEFDVSQQTAETFHDDFVLSKAMDMVHNDTRMTRNDKTTFAKKILSYLNEDTSTEPKKSKSGTEKIDSKDAEYDNSILELKSLLTANNSDSEGESMFDTSSKTDDISTDSGDENDGVQTGGVLENNILAGLKEPQGVKELASLFSNPETKGKALTLLNDKKSLTEEQRKSVYNILGREFDKVELSGGRKLEIRDKDGNYSPFKINKLLSSYDRIVRGIGNERNFGIGNTLGNRFINPASEEVIIQDIIKQATTEGIETELADMGFNVTDEIIKQATAPPTVNMDEVLAGEVVKAKEQEVIDDINRQALKAKTESTKKLDKKADTIAKDINPESGTTTTTPAKQREKIAKVAKKTKKKKKVSKKTKQDNVVPREAFEVALWDNVSEEWQGTLKTDNEIPYAIVMTKDIDSGITQEIETTLNKEEFDALQKGKIPNTDTGKHLKEEFDKFNSVKSQVDLNKKLAEDEKSIGISGLKREKGFKHYSSSEIERISDNEALADKIKARLLKAYPNIKAEELDKILKKGREIAGLSLGAMVQWSKNASLDTIPHEYFHSILDILEDDPVIKKILSKGIYNGIPDFSILDGTQEAFSYGLSVRGNKEAIKGLMDKIVQIQVQINLAKQRGDIDTTIQIAYKKQLYTEALEAATFTGGYKSGIESGFIKEDDFDPLYWSKEALTEEIGRDFVNKEKHDSVWQRIKDFLQHIVTLLKIKLKGVSNIDTEELMRFIADNFFYGRYKDDKYVGEDFYGPTMTKFSYGEVSQFNDEDNVNEDEDNDQLNALESMIESPEKIVKQVFNKALGEYITPRQFAMIAEMARDSETVESFSEKYSNFIQKEFKKSLKGVDGSLKSVHKKAIARMFQSIHSTTFKYDSKNNPGGRIKVEIMHESRFGKVLGVDVALEKKKNPLGVTNPNSFPTSFVEHDFNRGLTSTRFVYMPSKSFFQHINIPEKKISFFTQKAFRLNEENLEMINHRLDNGYKKGLLAAPLYVFFDKKGDNGQILLTSPSEEIENMNKEEFENYFLAEKGKGIVTKEDIKNFNSYVNNNRKVPLIYAKTVSYHETWKALRGNNYLELGGIGKQAKRLSGDFSQGIMTKGIGQHRIMHIDTNDIVLENRHGEEVKLGKPTDGMGFGSGAYLTELSNLNGTTSPVIKPYIRHLADNMTDYISVKFLLTTIPNKIKIKSKYDGTYIGEVRGTGKSSQIFIKDSDGKMKEVDLLLTDEEVKISSGDYAEYNKIITLPEEAMRIIQIADKEKNRASHPIAAWEMGLSQSYMFNKDGKMRPEVKELYKNINGYYNHILSHNINKLFDFIENPSTLKDYIVKEVEVGEEPSSLQIVAGINEKGILHPEYINQALPIINKGIFRKSILGGRDVANTGTKLYFKPDIDVGVKDGYVSFSADSSVMLNYAEKLYLKDNEGEAPWTNGDFINKVKTINAWLSKNPVWVLTFRQPVTDLTSVEPRKIQSFVLGFHGQTVFHTEADVRLLYQGDNDGDTGQYQIPSNIYIKNIIDNINTLKTKDFHKKRTKPMDLGIFEGNDVNERLSKVGEAQKLINSNSDAAGSQGLTVSSKQIASNLDVKNFSVTFTIYNEKRTYKIRPQSSTIIMDYAPLDKFMSMDRFDFIQKNGDKVVDIRGEELKTFEEFIRLDDNAYLQTTFSNEQQLLIQAAVDNANLHLLEKWGYGGDFVSNRMFISDNGYIDSKEARVLSQMTGLFSYSKMRKMRDQNGNLLKIQSFMAESIDVFNRYNNFDGVNGVVEKKTNQEVGDSIIDEHSKRVSDPKFRSYYPVKYKRKVIKNGSKHTEMVSVVINKVSVKNRVSPLEKLIGNIPMKQYEVINSEKFTKRDRTTSLPFLFDSVAYKFFHAKSMEALWNVEKKGHKEILANPKANELVVEEIRKAIAFTENVSNRYFGEIMQSISDERKGNIDNVSSDFNEDIIEFIDKALPKWNSLSSVAKKYSTLYFLNGTQAINELGQATKKTFINKLLPVQIMDKGVLKMYFDFYYDAMSEKVKVMKPSDVKTGFKFIEIQRQAKALKANKTVKCI